MAETDRPKLSRRAFLKLVGASAASTLLGSGSSDNKFIIEPLPSAVEIFVQPSYTQPRVLESQKNIEIASLEEFRPLYYRIEEFKAKWKVVPPFLNDIYLILKLYFESSSFELSNEQKVIRDILTKDWGSRIDYVQEDAREKQIQIYFSENFTDTEKKDLIKGLILSILEEFPLLKLSSPSSFYFYTDKDVDIHNCRSIALGCTDFHKYIAVKVDDSSLILELLFHELLHNFLDPEIVVLKRIFNYLDKFEYITFWVSFLDLIDEFLNFLLTVPENIYGLEDYGFSDYKEREESLKIWKLIADKKPRYYKLSFIDGFIRELKVSQNTGFSPEFSQVLFREISLLFHLMHNVYLSDYNNASRSLLLRYKSKGRVVKKFEDIWKRFQSNWLNLSRSEIDIDNFFNDLKY